MEDLAGWVAPIATMIAAMITAANLGARITGWGFVVFTIGSIAWSIVGITTGQTNLVASNGFLTLVNLVGIWRWLGRQAVYDDGARSAKAASHRRAVPSLFTATSVAGLPVTDAHGIALGRVVEALIECSTGHVSYIVVASGGVAGVDESLRAVSRADLIFESERVVLDMPTTKFESSPVLAPGDWPASAKHADTASH